MGFPSLATEGVLTLLNGLPHQHGHLFLHQFELLLEPGVVPILLQADPLGLLPAAHSMVLLHLLDLLLLLTLQVLQFCVKEFLLGLEGAKIQRNSAKPLYTWEEDGELCSDLGLHSSSITSLLCDLQHAA